MSQFYEVVGMAVSVSGGVFLTIWLLTGVCYRVMKLIRLWHAFFDWLWYRKQFKEWLQKRGGAQ